MTELERQHTGEIFSGIGGGRRNWIFAENGNFLSVFGINNRISLIFNLGSKADIDSKLKIVYDYRDKGYCSMDEVSELEEKIRTLSNFVIGGRDEHSDVGLSEGYWFGEYVNYKKQTKKIIFFYKGDFDEAEKYMYDIIPEPYSKTILKGSCEKSMFKDLQKSGYEMLSEGVSNISKNFIYNDSGSDEKKIYKKFLDDIDSLVNSISDIKVIVDADLKGIYLRVYGFDKDFTDDMDFERIWDKNKLLKYGKDVIGHWNSLKNYKDIYASTYFTAKTKVGSKNITTGPYIEFYYVRDDITNESVVLEGSRVKPKKGKKYYTYDENGTKVEHIARGPVKVPSEAQKKAAANARKYAHTSSAEDKRRKTIKAKGDAKILGV